MATKKCFPNSRSRAKKMAWGMIAFLVVSFGILLVSMFAARSVHAAEPSTFASLQPFQKFGKGEGEGVAYWYEPRTKAQLIALLRDKKLAKKEMRVSCDVLVRQMVEAHKGLPFEGCEGAAAALEHDDFTVVACRNDMFQRDSWLTVTNESGNAFGVWHRTCLPNEQVLTYKGQSVMSTTCLNVAIPVTTVAPAPMTATTPTGTAACPGGFRLVANAWSLSLLPEGLREQANKLKVVAEKRDTENATNQEAYKPDAVSRTLGGQLRREVQTRASVNTMVKVQIRDPQSLQVLDEMSVHLSDGMGNITLSSDQRAKIVETIWPATFVSPSVSGGERRLWLFPNEWGKWCEMNVHGLVP